MPKMLYLLDGHAIAYRNYFALTSGGTARFATTDGEPTAGVFGFASTLLKILEQDEPDYLAIAFDKGRTFRDDLYEEYKATREKMPDDLRSQIERIKQMIDLLKIPRLELDNYEADDIISSLATWAANEEGLGVKIITGDRDLLQLVTERIVVNLPEGRGAKDRDYFPEDVVERMGVKPEQVVDLKALMGDSSDNIPGVRGVGPKTATKLLESYGTLDGVYEHVDEIQGKVGQNIAEQKEQAYLSQTLARIVVDLPVRLDLEQAACENFEPVAAEELFRELEFRTLIRRLQKLSERYAPTQAQAPRTITPETNSFNLVQGGLFGDEPLDTPDALISIEEIKTDFETVIVDTPQKLAQAVKDLSAYDTLAFDTETSTLDPVSADLVGFSLAASPEKGYYFPVGHRAGKQLSLDELKNAVQPLLSDPKIAKVAHHAKFDLIVLRQAGFEIDPIRFDTMIAEWLINPDSRNLGLKTLAWVRLGVEMTPIEDLIGKGKNQLSMADLPIARVAPYAAADAVMTLRLMPILKADLKERNAEKLMDDLEIKLVPVLAQMEEYGVLLDAPFFEAFNEELTEMIFALEEDIYRLAGTRFNINSTQKLSDVLFKKLALDPPDPSRKTKSGHYSTSAEILELLRDKHEIVAKILDYREYAKLKSTYVEALPQQINPKTGRVHSSFNQVGTVTGRIASQNPNLQNIPTRTDLGQRVRQGFIAAPGWKLLSVDYSQVELRIVAHIAQDQAMIEAFRRGQDIHATTAAAITGTPLAEVTPKQRRNAKAVNFGLIYGMSAFGLTRGTDLTLAEAENFIKAYFREFPGVKAWLDMTRVNAAKNGYVETLLGRRRYFPNLAKGSNPQMRQREEREAINAPIQGTAADIVKLAMIALPEALRKAGLNARMLLQVHDELIFEVPEDELERTVPVVKSLMESAMTLDVPLVCDARAGDNWRELKAV
ncbi:MAG TPA: DNA polymerase I [Anaerolineaceae bacterium]|nr:DNA polymerase I [Anaerolineaceae bacterium]